MNFPNFRLSKKRLPSQLPRGQKRCVGENEVGDEKEIRGTSCLEKKKMTSKACLKKIVYFLQTLQKDKLFRLSKLFSRNALSKGNFFIRGNSALQFQNKKFFCATAQIQRNLLR